MGLAARAGAAAVGLLLAAGLPATASGGDQRQVTGSEKLSNERTLTRWAHPERRAPIRSRPSTKARSIVSTRLDTEDGFPEVYLVLRRWSTEKGPAWYQVRIPMRPNGRVGWVRASALGPLYRVKTQLVVNRSSQRALLFKNGRKIWSEPVGIGKASTPTPKGKFWIREKFKTGDSGGPYGPMAFGTSNYSVLSDWPGGGVIGIHGTDKPSLIPGRPSHGCIRVKNGALRKLWRLLPVGTPLLIK